MTTDRDVPFLPTRSGRIPLPARVQDLEDEIKTHRTALAQTLGIFRGAFHEFARQWIRENAKRVAIAQNLHTLKLGREEITRLKHEIEDHGHKLRRAIDEEFKVEGYTEAESVSSGQVGQLVARRFEAGMRKLLASVGTVLEKAGYVPDEHWLEPDPHSPKAVGPTQALEMPPDLLTVLGQVKDALIDIKVAEAKISYFALQREKEKAAELWETS